MYNIGEKRQRRARIAAAHIMALAVIFGGMRFGYAPAYTGDHGNPMYSPKRTKLKGWQKQVREQGRNHG